MITLDLSERPNQRLSTSRKLSGITSFNTAELTFCNNPFSFALTSLAASTVSNMSAGVFFPSISKRFINVSALPVIRLTSMPVFLLKFSSNGLISASFLAE